VAWYPIYRIPEKPLKACFLSYHQLAPPEEGGSDDPEGSAAAAAEWGGGRELTVVGLEWYNADGDGWFDTPPGAERAAAAAADALRAGRLEGLQAGAATLSLGLLEGGSRDAASKGGGSSRHSDYQFFLRRK